MIFRLLDKIFMDAYTKDGIYKKELSSLKISTKGRYGLMAVIYLATHYESGHIPLNIIAENQGLSSNYLEHIFSGLKKAGIVKSVKGAQGGYILAEKPALISAGKVLRALEGDLSVVGEGDTADAKSIEASLRVCLWNKLDDAIRDIVDNISIEDILLHYITAGQDGLMFHI